MKPKHLNLSNSLVSEAMLSCNVKFILQCFIVTVDHLHASSDLADLLETSFIKVLIHGGLVAHKLHSQRSVDFFHVGWGSSLNFQTFYERSFRRFRRGVMPQEPFFIKRNLSLIWRDSTNRFLIRNIKAGFSICVNGKSKWTPGRSDSALVQIAPLLSGWWQKVSI